MITADDEFDREFQRHGGVILDAPIEGDKRVPEKDVDYDRLLAYRAKDGSLYWVRRDALLR